MNVERRYSARHPIELRVQIRYRKRRFYCATGRNLSNQGIYLDVKNVTLPIGTLVELEFQALGRDWLVPGIVAHHYGVGIGVMFRDQQPELYQRLPQTNALTVPPQPVAAGQRCELGR